MDLAQPPNAISTIVAEIFSAMIPEVEGRLLVKVMRAEGRTHGVLIPMNCFENSGIGDKNEFCHPALKSDRELVRNLPLVRKMKWAAN